MMNNLAVSTAFNVTTMKRKVVLATLAMLALLVVLFMPENAYAAEETADDTMNATLGLFLKFVKFIAYTLLGLVFVAAAYWIFQSVTRWTSGDREGSIGNILVTVLISIVVVGIVFVLVTKGIDVLDTNITTT